MAKKMTKVEIIDKIIDTLNVLVIPVTTIIAIWAGVDYSIYVAGTAALVCSVCEYLKLFCKK